MSTYLTNSNELCQEARVFSTYILFRQRTTEVHTHLKMICSSASLSFSNWSCSSMTRLIQAASATARSRLSDWRRWSSPSFSRRANKICLSVSLRGKKTLKINNHPAGFQPVYFCALYKSLVTQCQGCAQKDTLTASFTVIFSLQPCSEARRGFLTAYL